VRRERGVLLRDQIGARGERVRDQDRDGPRRRFLPTLGVSGTLNGASNGTPSGHDVDASAALTATWTIWDGGARDADAESRDAAAEIADLGTDTLARTVDAQVRTAAAQLASAQQALAASKDAMVAAQKSADETAILYKQGLARAIELVDANETRFQAEVSFASAQFSVATAYLSLRQTVGLDPIGGGTP
jgi:outer membrane protein TolC